MGVGPVGAEGFEFGGEVVEGEGGAVGGVGGGVVGGGCCEGVGVCGGGGAVGVGMMTRGGVEVGRIGGGGCAYVAEVAVMAVDVVVHLLGLTAVVAYRGADLVEEEGDFLLGVEGTGFEHGVLIFELVEFGSGMLGVVCELLLDLLVSLTISITFLVSIVKLRLES